MSGPWLPTTRRGFSAYRGFESFENRDPSARWTFFDPAPPRFAAKTKLALKRSNSRLCGRYAARAGHPEKSPMRASGIRFPSCARVLIHESVSERIPRGLPRGKRATTKGFVPLRIEDSPQLAAEIFNSANETGRSLEKIVLKQIDEKFWRNWR